MNRTTLILLKFGTLQTVLMALYHFALPYQFGWGKYLANESPTINWSLYSLNNYFSFNLLVLSVFLTYFLFKRIDSIQTIKTLSIIILLFWLFSFIYQLIEPMPLPHRLEWLSIVLPGLALFNAMIFAVPLRSLQSGN